MILLAYCTVLLHVALRAAAQTPANFSIQSTLPLGAIAEPSEITITPGILLAQSDVLLPPALQSVASTDASAYMAFMVDPGAPFLHWFQPNLAPTTASNATLSPATNASFAGAEYLPPQPPAGDGPHNYVLLLFGQPQGWTLPNNYSFLNNPTDPTVRFGFDILDFTLAAQLGSPLGSKYFRNLNGTVAESSSASTATVTGNGAPATADTTVFPTSVSATTTAIMASSTAGTSPSSSPSTTANAGSGNSRPVIVDLLLSICCVLVLAVWM